MKKCECCREEKSKYNAGGFSLCGKCHLVAKKDFDKVKELIETRQEKKIDDTLEEIKG
ncbi:MAG: hypothetical protein ACOC1X_02045 [Promethearchaeota archaeon]